MRVHIDTRTVGDHFGTCAVIRSVRGRIICQTKTRAYGFVGPAIADAVAICKQNGWTIVRRKI